MIALIKWMIFGHLHKWITLSEHDFYEREGGKTPTGKVFIQQCEHCGKVSRRNLIG